MDPGRTGYGQAMAPDSPDWTVPAPLRALLWWPGIAFVLALVAPEPVGSIAAAGLLLMGLGALAEAVGRRTRRTAGGVDAPELEPA